MSKERKDYESVGRELRKSGKTSQIEVTCPECGSTIYRKFGFRYTRKGKYQVYQCKNCWHYFRAD